ncbi:MAG: hypothetical protein IPK01_14610 [Acidobacteria bacterium]|nr:hypothetical protein [Acidobacteriota bacterium]
MPLHFLNRKHKILTAFAVCVSALAYGCSYLSLDRPNLKFVSTIAGIDNSIGEPFRHRRKDGVTYVSDGEKGSIWQIAAGGERHGFRLGLDTPSSIAFDKNGDLIVADSGTQHHKGR